MSELDPLSNRPFPSYVTKNNPTYRRNAGEKRRDFQLIGELYVKGYDIKHITEAVNAQYPEDKRLSKRRIYLDVQELVEAWRQDAFRNIEIRKAEQLAKLSRVETEYWEAWEKSKQEKKIVTTEAIAGGLSLDEGGSGAGRKRRVQTRLEQSVGDPRFLEGIVKVLEQRTKLLGLNEPARYEVSVIKDMKDDELEQLIRDISAEVQEQERNTIEGVARDVSNGIGGGEEAGDSGREISEQ